MNNLFSVDVDVYKNEKLSEYHRVKRCERETHLD